jgi:hypothetical protein
MSNNTRTGGDDETGPSNGSSDTTFGLSTESQAQRQDAVTIGSDVVGEVLNIYRLVPLAAPDDPNWDNAPSHGEVLVAARTTGDARIVAASRELDFMEIDASPAGGVTTTHASSFRNEKLYTVIEVERGREDVRRGVLEGEIPVDTIKPTQL